MAQPYVGEIRMFAGNFAPAGWAMCAGQLMPIAENDTLFTLIGTTYGGDGQETFGLPDLQGRIPIHQGTGPGLSSYVIGEKAGTESVTLTTQQMPTHNHGFAASTAGGQYPVPQDHIPASPPVAKFYRAGVPSDPFPNTLVQPAFGSQPHDNMMPYIVINYIISLFGIFPSQT
jgi:microcystin-dependent protein